MVFYLSYIYLLVGWTIIATTIHCVKFFTPDLSTTQSKSEGQLMQHNIQAQRPNKTTWVFGGAVRLTNSFAGKIRVFHICMYIMFKRNKWNFL